MPLGARGHQAGQHRQPRREREGSGHRHQVLRRVRPPVPRPPLRRGRRLRRRAEGVHHARPQHAEGGVRRGEHDARPARRPVGRHRGPRRPRPGQGHDGRQGLRREPRQPGRRTGGRWLGPPARVHVQGVRPRRRGEGGLLGPVGVPCAVVDRHPERQGSRSAVDGAGRLLQGAASLVRATQNSINTVYAQLASALGIDNVIGMAHQLGVSTSSRQGDLPPVPSIVLGSGERVGARHGRRLLDVRQRRSAPVRPSS